MNSSKKKSGGIFYAFLTIAAFALISLSLSGCAKKSYVTGTAKTGLKVKAVRTRYKLVSNYLKSPGNVNSLNNTAISAHIMGYVVFENVHNGQTALKGQLLLRLSAPEIISKYHAAKAGFLNAKKTYDRIKKLYGENYVSKQTYDNTFMRYNVAKADLNEAHSYLNYINIYSPINGVITQKRVYIGDLVSPGETLLTVRSIKELEFKTYVNVKYYSKLRQNESVELNFTAVKGSVIGRIISVVRSAGRYSHSILVRIGVTGAKNLGLMPGMYGIASFKIGSKKVILIPKNAVLKRLGIWGVYIATGSGEVIFQPVSKGSIYNKDFVIVLNGLVPGMTVITSNLNEITAGSRVTPKLN